MKPASVFLIEKLDNTDTPLTPRQFDLSRFRSRSVALSLTDSHERVVEFVEVVKE